MDRDNEILIQSLTIRPDEVIELVYTMPTWMTPKAAKFVMLTFDRDVIPDIDLTQLEDCMKQMCDDVEVAIRNPEPTR